MAEKTPNPIIKREKIIVDHVKTNDYGDLVVVTKTGNEYKIGVKRKQLHNVFQPNAEIVIGFASYMNKEYIAEATASKQIVSTDTPIQTEKPKIRDDTKERSMSIAYAKDLVVAGKIELKEVIIYANKFLEYILNKEVKTAAKSRLVEQAKQAGAIEIEEGGE